MQSSQGREGLSEVLPVMSTYRKMSIYFWTGPMGQQLLKADASACCLGLYLMSNQYTDVLGLYYLPIQTMQSELHFSWRKIERLLKRLIAMNFCRYDTQHQYVWVCEMAASQISYQLQANDKQVIGIHRQLSRLPELVFLSDFIARYKESFHLKIERIEEGRS
jgi:hypothetical protein